MICFLHIYIYKCGPQFKNMYETYGHTYIIVIYCLSSFYFCKFKKKVFFSPFLSTAAVCVRFAIDRKGKERKGKERKGKERKGGKSRKPAL